MPYRRLPNTDKARIRAMRAALEQAERDSESGIVVVPFDLVYKLRLLLPEFEQAVDLYSISHDRQVEAGKEMRENFKKAKLYLSHFVQVFNMAILRGEIKQNEREFLNLPVDELSLPKIQSEKELLTIGRMIIQGEEKRLFHGLTPITNPKISIVKIYFERFEESYHFYKKLQEVTAANLKNIAKLRPKVDVLIQSVWNKVEESFENYPAELKREKSRKYGVVYFYRKEEKKAINKNL